MSRSTRNPGNGCRHKASVPPPSPPVPPPKAVAGPSRLAPSRPALGTTVLATSTTFLAIVREVGEMLCDIPYVKAISGVLLRIIKIKEELTETSLRCLELIDKALRRSEAILCGVKQIAHSPMREGLRELEDDLIAYGSLLDAVYAALIQCTSKKLSDRVDRFLNRNQLLDDILRLERLLDDFRVNFSDKTLVRMEIHMNTLLSWGPSRERGIYRPILPPKPSVMYGRGREQKAILATLMGSAPARIAILGAGGIGKTTLAVSVLYDEEVISRYNARYFVACDGVTSAELLLTELANVLRLPRNQLDENMHDLVLSSFRRDNYTGIICFDNLETAWDNPEGRRAVEDLLTEFMAIPNLALLVTMRGTQRPAPSAGWSIPFLQPLHSLHFPDAVNVFRYISGQMDEFAEQMIKEVDCIPLAVTLLGHMVQEENETTASLANRWSKERTALIENGGDDRLSKLDKSIQCSLTSPRMKQDPSATNILALLSLLPDGFPNRPGMLDRLQGFLPPSVNIQKAVSTLRRVALVHCETLVDTPRLRLLSPVRHFSKANIPILPEHGTALVDLYIQILEDGKDYSDPHSHTFIPPELLNMRAVFAEAYMSGDRRVELVKASITYTEWLVFMGSGSEEIIQLAIQSMHESDALLPACFYWLGRLCMRRNDIEDAHRAFLRAVKLHVQANDTSGEAYDLYELGSLYIWWGKLEDAEQSFKRALELHKAGGDFLGEAYDLLDLGKLFMRRGLLAQAEKCTSDALDLLKEVHNVLGEAHAMRRLGGVYLRQDRLDEAEETLWGAVKLHRQTRSVLGEAHDMRRLGGLYMWRHQLDEAELCFTKAAELHRQSHDLLGEANDTLNMGELYMERGQLSDAESSLNDALRLHLQIQNVLGRANDMQNLGELYKRRNQVAEAQVSLAEAVELHQQSGDVLGLAKDMQKIGELCVQTGDFDEAEKALRSAVKLHRQACNQVGAAYGLQSLAKLSRMRGQGWMDFRGHGDGAPYVETRLELRWRVEGSGYSV
ncbi:Tetratricopeptide repeat protein 28 [Favolaschia claudopus]|uniref:Tetratricopeptide repeat protein 28 n=1 Tax=Favolaschia claudopus TaxID=2862362 RepID=A0AAW0DFZ4_9AGAR